MAAIGKHGWLRDLRRWSGVGALLFAVIFVVGTVRAHALAQAVGDDDICVVMGGQVAPRAPVTDPTDLTDRTHACCDLGLCLDAAALPPTAPALGLLARRALTRSRSPRPQTPVSRPRRAGYRPRDPPVR